MRIRCLLNWTAILLLLPTGSMLKAQDSGGDEVPGWLRQPLPLEQALNIALDQNAEVLKARQDLEAAHGIAVQTRAIVFPRLQATAEFLERDPDSFETFVAAQRGRHQWTADVRLVQSIYEGGRMISSWRSADLTRERAYQDYQTIVADILLNVRVAYADVLLAKELITVQEASVHLLQQELEDTRVRFEAGTVPHFNVLRAEVEVANARPRLIRARNDSRIARQRLVNLLGYDLPREIQEDVPLNLSDQLVARPYDIELSQALAQALKNRSELVSLQKSKRLRQEDIAQARAGYKPSLQLFAGYGSRNSLFSASLRDDVSGWNAGAQLSWDLFDGLLTQGDIKEAKARYNRSLVELEDVRREIELEVRTAYSNFIEANELLESQKKVTEQAEEALRLAIGRFRAGTGTQLDVLSAQTALTEARSTYVQALRDYTVARARLERAIGQSIEKNVGSQDPSGSSDE